MDDKGSIRFLTKKWGLGGAIGVNIIKGDRGAVGHLGGGIIRHNLGRGAVGHLGGGIV